MNYQILIIDDERDLCKLIADFLTKKDYQVKSTHSIAEGFKQLIKLHPQVVLLDNNLPDGIGLNCIERIKSLDANVKIIFVSAMADLKMESIAKGADVFLEKPVSFKVLIKNLLSMPVGLA